MNVQATESAKKEQLTMRERMRSKWLRLSDTPNSYGVDYKPENTGDDDHDGQRERPSDYFVSETFINHSYE